MRDLLLSGGYEVRSDMTGHVGGAIGSGVHAAAGYTLTEKRSTGELGNEREAIDRAEAEFLERAQYGVIWDEATDSRPTAQKQLARMTRVYRRDVATEIDPTLIEERLEADIGDGWVLSGQMDSFAGNPDDVIDDLKTGTRQRDNGVQYALYAVLLRGYSFEVRGIRERYIARVPLRKEQPPARTSSVDLNAAIIDAWEIVEDIKRSTELFRERLDNPGHRPPIAAFRANPASQLCSAKWCPAWGTATCSRGRN